MSDPISLKPDYWETLKISSDDLELIYNHLLEVETPQTPKELAKALVIERIKKEKLLLEKQKSQDSLSYLPKEKYKTGQTLIFPSLSSRKGKVVSIRPGYNPDLPSFEVIEVDFGNNEKHSFAAVLADHALNNPIEPVVMDDSLNPDVILKTHGVGLQQKLEKSLNENKELVRIAGRWFPRSLLVDVNIGHLNLAEAVLEMNDGGPLPTTAILDQIELPTDVNLKLTEFSLNLALQEDPRFDEVGPAGEVLWYLERLEPDGTRKTPTPIQYQSINFNDGVLTPEMTILEEKLDDELSPVTNGDSDPFEVTLTLIYPHLRAGTLPLSGKIRKLFPTAYESPRIRFNLRDGKTGKTFPGWVVRANHYVFGLSEWYLEQEMIPGSLLTIRRGDHPGEVIVEAQKRRPAREWIRTILFGADGGFVFAMLKQNISTSYDELMAIAVPDNETMDRAHEALVKSHTPFEKLTVNMMRELSKLNPQGRVHAQELYAAINLVRRCPPGPILRLLGSKSSFEHLGDLHYKLGESSTD